MKWMTDSSGNKSASVTLLVVSFVVTTVVFIAGAIQQIGPVMFRSFDVAACAAYFVPIATMYFGRRWTSAKYSQQSTAEQEQQQESDKAVING